MLNTIPVSLATLCSVTTEEVLPQPCRICHPFLERQLSYHTFVVVVNNTEVIQSG